MGPGSSGTDASSSHDGGAPLEAAPGGQGKRGALTASLERIGAVSAGLVVLGTLASLLDVTGWFTVVFVLVGSLGLAIAVAKWRTSRWRALCGAAVALVGVIGIVGLVPDGADGEKEPSALTSGAKDGVPITVAAQGSANSCGLGWIIPAEPQSLKPAPTAGGDVSSWANGLHGVPADGMSVRLTVDSPGHQKVTLHDIRIVPVRKSAPVTGTHAAFACGGEGAYRYMSVDLDRSPPKRTFEVAEESSDSVPPHELKPIALPYEVSATDPENFWIFARASRFDVQWVIEIDWAFQGRTGVVRVDDHGSPFRVTGKSAAADTCVWLSDSSLDPTSSSSCPTAGG